MTPFYPRRKIEFAIIISAQDHQYQRVESDNFDVSVLEECSIMKRIVEAVSLEDLDRDAP